MTDTDDIITLVCHKCRKTFTNDPVTLAAAVWENDEPTCEDCELIPAADAPRISIDTESGEFIRCHCGNATHTGGFYPCTETGQEVEMGDGDWPLLYLCAECGRIIDDTGLVLAGPATVDVVDDMLRRDPFALPVIT